MIEEQAPHARAVEVAAQLKQLKDDSEDTYLTTCELLYEASTMEYHLAFGYTTFADWVSMGSGLGISPRQAYYLVGIHSKALQLGITRAQLKACNVSKLKWIFSLDVAIFAEQMIDLVERAPGMTHEQVKHEVAKLKCEDGEEPDVYMTLKLAASVKQIKDEAFETARRLYGSVETPTGPVEISDSKCCEIIFTSFIQDPNNSNQG